MYVHASFNDSSAYMQNRQVKRQLEFGSECQVQWWHYELSSDTSFKSPARQQAILRLFLYTLHIILDIASCSSQIKCFQYHYKPPMPIRAAYKFWKDKLRVASTKEFQQWNWRRQHLQFCVQRPNFLCDPSYNTQAEHTAGQQHVVGL